MWVEIDANFWIAAALYLTMSLPLAVMAKARGVSLGPS
jgi:hypothetical protein